MAVPKRKHSKQRTAKRRANWKVTAKNLVTCTNCGNKMLPHRVCPTCGYYNKEQIIQKNA